MSLTIKQVMERIDQLQMKRDMIEAIQEWLKKSFTGTTGVKGRNIPPEVIDELLVDIDADLLAKTDDEIEQLGNMEVDSERKKQRQGKSAKAPKKRSNAKKGKGS